MNRTAATPTATAVLNEASVDRPTLDTVDEAVADEAVEPASPTEEMGSYEGDLPGDVTIATFDGVLMRFVVGTLEAAEV